MNSDASSGQSRSTSPLGAKSSATSAESSPKHLESEDIGRDGLKDLRRDMSSMKDSLARLASQATGEAAKTVRSVSQTLASQVGGAASGVADAGSDLASSATTHVKTFASELESMARRNPLGTVAVTLLVGVIVGMMARGRG